MLFGNNTMTLVTDLNIATNEINNIDFIAVAAVTSSEDYEAPNIFNASILIPPTDILMAWADGNTEVLYREYPRYLCNCKDADDMIVALLAALVKRNIIIYIPIDEFNIFGGILINHIYMMYGITMNTPNTLFRFDESKLPLILSKFYMMDIMTPQDFLASYPSNCKLIDFTINKLAVDLHPFNMPVSWQQYAEYFNGIVAGNSAGNRNMVRLIK